MALKCILAGKSVGDHVESFNGRTGFVLPQTGDYTAAMVGARASTWMPSAADVGAVPTSRTVNGKALSSNITLSASDVSAVPTTRKVNNKTLNADISLTASDVGAVPTSRTVNGKALSSNITLSANDIIDGVKIETGSYTGTGTYGKNNPNSLTFSFKPKMVWVYGGYALGYSGLIATPFFYHSLNLGYTFGTAYNWYNTAYGIMYYWEGNTISWYHENSANRQMNGNEGTDSGRNQYYYIAIG